MHTSDLEEGKYILLNLAGTKAPVALVISLFTRFSLTWKEQAENVRKKVKKEHLLMLTSITFSDTMC